MEDIASYLVQMILPALAGAALWAVSLPCRRRGRCKKGYCPGPAREGALLLCFMFSVGLLALTLTPAGFWDAIHAGRLPYFPAPFQSEVNLIPVKRSWEILCYYVRHELWSAIWVNFPGNIVMFLPIGFFAGLLMDKPRWWKSTLMAAALSLFIEIFQLFVSRGTDVDDLILNTLGGLLGHGAFLLLRRAAPGLVAKCAKQ